MEEEKAGEIYEVVDSSDNHKNDKVWNSSQKQQTLRYDTQHAYELQEFNKKNDRNETQNIPTKYNKSKSTWNGPVIAIIVLLLLILLLLVILLGMTGLMLTKGDTGSSYSEAASATLADNRQPGPNLTEWADSVAHNVYQLINSNRQPGPNFTEWADGVAHNVFQLQNNTSPQWAKEMYQNNTLIMSKLLNMSLSTANGVKNEIMYQENTTQLLDRLFAVTSSSAQKLTNIVGTLSNIKYTCTSTAGVVDDILLVVQDLLNIHINLTSCKDIKKIQPYSPSGYYFINNRTVYCNMDELCGEGGGWTRLAYLNMSDATQNCPSGFRLYQSGAVRACGRPTLYTGSCQSVTFSSNGISYSQVCGRVVGYQYYTPNGVDNTSYSGAGHHDNLNSFYVDGVSITRGSPRQHVWTLMAGLQDSYIYNSLQICPCANGSSSQVQSFVGGYYFCESGNPSSIWSHSLYTSDPLWDGQGCGSLETSCCTAPGLPWFHRQYNTTTTDYLELRVCGDQSTWDEDAPVSFYEIYVK